MVPFGVGTLVGTFVGGRSADFGAVLKGKGGRLIAPVTGSIAIAGSLLLFAGVRRRERGRQHQRLCSYASMCRASRHTWCCS